MTSVAVHWRFSIPTCLILLTLLCGSCKKNSQPETAFYYWKQQFSQNKAQEQFLAEAGSNKLYIRFFDIKWDDKTHQPYPEAVIRFNGTPLHQEIIPTLFITNETFEKLSKPGIDSLVVKTVALIKRLAQQQKIDYATIQVDCDWTIGTKEKYFSFLKALKVESGKKLEATIRLHQVKYQFKTGVPPVDRGVLMFYNMGKLSPDLKEPNSIYSPKVAAGYIRSLPNYLLPLDIALPVFSWSLQIRDGRLIQVYGKIGRTELEDKTRFEQTAQKHVYKAIKSFFSGGIYIKTSDIFKLEETDKELLEQAAAQLATYLNKKERRTIIYYELGNLNLSAFKAKDFKEISAYF
uniref:hypothetical protein n=1 Tax=Pedobacter schmidteae TaxID=2201271 RepID=UPI001D0071FB|nr:hypothetical protein [Pedobacter schmidteae]